ncbi:spore germination protein [Paenibacillus turpanensis]|uniref:spore germination protein n=1 Tax=Paenibacillus turpanensis TaxID=2689078 RepID=UPI00140E5EBC|nr:spore germination protein [Paenibacillus turpanensis]
MSHINNIYNLRVNNVSSNGSINFGNVIHKGHNANSKSIGGQTIIGDSYYSPAISNYNRNYTVDPDMLDQVSKQI